jgi:hypothetical protein
METLHLKPLTLLVFIDETGNEDYSDPKNPTFGRGGCAILGENYQSLIKRPWRKLKREKLGGAMKPFHATDFEQSRPTLAQITSINSFLERPFWRFAIMSDSRTVYPEGVDGHKAVSMTTIKYISDWTAQHPVKNVALVFEASDRGDTLVKRDFDLANMNLKNSKGEQVEVDGFFIEKKYMEAGLEVADLVAHTAGRQRRHQLAGKDGVTKDFEKMYWHSPIPPKYISIDIVKQSESGT